MKSSVLLLALTASACGPVGAPFFEGFADAPPSPFSENHLETIDVGSWNLEWFGAPDKGPADEVTQQSNVKTVLGQLDLDVVGLVEVVSEEAFHALVSGLPEYDGILVTDPRVSGGAASYSAREQKVALLYKRRFTVETARVVLTDASSAFAGRPPMELTLSFSENGTPQTVVVMVVHLKALANLDGYTRRTEAAAVLKNYLDTAHIADSVLVIGDFNDDIDVSTYQRQVSPFAALVADVAYQFTTATLSASGTSTTTTYSSTIDHHLITDDLAPRFVANSAMVVHPEAFVTNYGVTTSDHFPVVTRYDFR